MHFTFEPQPLKKDENSELKPPKLKPPALLTLAGGTKAPAGKAETLARTKTAFENLIFSVFLFADFCQKFNFFEARACFAVCDVWWWSRDGFYTPGRSADLKRCNYENQFFVFVF